MRKVEWLTVVCLDRVKEIW